MTRFVRNGDATSWTWLLLQSAVQIADLTCARSPLVGFVHWCPFADISIVRPLPAESENSTFGNLAPTRLRVPSSWFHTTSTVYSARQFQVYCNLYRPGFDTFPHSGPPNQQADSKPLGSTSPRRGHPSKNLSRRQPCRIAATVAFLRFPLATLPVPSPPKRLPVLTGRGHRAVRIRCKQQTLPSRRDESRCDRQRLRRDATRPHLAPATGHPKTTCTCIRQEPKFPTDGHPPDRSLVDTRGRPTRAETPVQRGPAHFKALLRRRL